MLILFFPWYFIVSAVGCHLLLLERDMDALLFYVGDLSDSGNFFLKAVWFSFVGRVSFDFSIRILFICFSLLSY